MASQRRIAASFWPLQFELPKEGNTAVTRRLKKVSICTGLSTAPNLSLGLATCRTIESPPIERLASDAAGAAMNCSFIAPIATTPPFSTEESF